ncbi:major facilitator superfamily domain-containing protein [Stachybotrys elegans]|uniref:Major facilitator superfamily domain-containing protein n=1 Tax=Stachybotrys elegans TaxID=80388 RepID=A0A8K0SP31_9HYPO|nr:major facilitator superfamily domain-containing protein [Stachybotrys elegans]
MATASPSSPHEYPTRSSSFSDAIHPVDDVETQYDHDEETAGRGIGALYNIRSRTRSEADYTVINWDVKDPENPYNWTNSKKVLVVLIIVLLVTNSTMGSALPSMAMPNIAAEFHVTSRLQLPLPISLYLVGFVVGALIWGPLSEHFGRRNLTLATLGFLAIFTMACALAPSWPVFLVFRLICGIFAASPIAVVAGIMADIYGEPRTRGRAFAIFMATTVFGPLFAPIISGFVAPAIGWRWSFWIGLIWAGVTFVFTLFLPETFGPILLARRAAKRRKSDPASRIVAPRDLEKTDMSQLLTVVLLRPVQMMVSELIVITSCAYLAYAYAIFYMYFQVFPIVFRDLYGLSPGVTGLVYLPIGGGALLALPVFWYWDHVLYTAQARGAAWTKREEYRRLPLAILGGPMFVISLFWLGYTARTSISFVVPLLAGIPFGMGYLLIFMAILNYLTDAYEIYAASANSASSFTRSLFAVVLPLATRPMFENLGISGACSLLGGLSAVLCIIPFVFIWKGPSIRARSRFCIALKEQKEMALREELQRAEKQLK